MKVDEFKKKVASGDISVGGSTKSYGRVDPAYKALLENLGRGKKKSTSSPGKKREDYMTEKAIDTLIDYWYKRGSIYIPYNVVSSKNSKRIVGASTGKPRLISSEAYMKYKRLSKSYWKQSRLLWLELVKDLEKPYKIGFAAIRFSQDRFDYHNMEQGPADLMQEFGWIEDDDKLNLKIIPENYKVDKFAQGIVITPLKDYKDARDERV